MQSVPSADRAPSGGAGADPQPALVPWQGTPLLSLCGNADLFRAGVDMGLATVVQSSSETHSVRTVSWGYSSVGRALEWHSRGQGFDPPQLHQKFQVLRPFFETAFFLRLLFASTILVSGS